MVARLIGDVITDAKHDIMRQITLRVPDDLHQLASEAAESQGQSLNTFAINGLLAQVGAKSFSQWREHIAASHQSAAFRGVTGAHDAISVLSGDE